MPVSTRLPLSYYRRVIDEGRAMVARWERERALGLGPEAMRRVQPIKHAGRPST